MKMRMLRLVLLMLMALPAAALAQKRQVQSRSFENIRLIELNAPGDIDILKSNQSQVTIELSFSYPADQITYSFKQEGNALTVGQSYHAPSVKNDGKWTILVPDLVEVRIVSGKGNIKIGRVNADIQTKTASGNIEVEDASGSFDLSTSKGSIVLRNIHFTGPGSLMASEGDITIHAMEKFLFDLTATTSSGDILVDLNGNSFEATLVTMTNKKHGDLRTPFTISTMEERKENRDTIVRHTFKAGDQNQKLTLTSGKGVVAVRK